MRTVLNSSVDPLLGRLLDGRYEISSRLAQGGMAVVYTRFRHPPRSRGRGEGHAPRARRRRGFRGPLPPRGQGSRPAVRAHTWSPSPIRASDCDVIFLVMELVDGRTLREVLREAGTPRRASEALQFMIPVLEALAAAHRAGLVHRDVKPENVLVADDGAVKVGDFGLGPRGRRLTADGDGRAAARHRRLPGPRAGRPRGGRRPR